MIISKKDLIKISSLQEVKRILKKLENRSQTKIQLAAGDIRIISLRDGKFSLN